MKVELSKEQVGALLQILANADIKGKDAGVIIDLAKALQTPAVEAETKA